VKLKIAGIIAATLLSAGISAQAQLYPAREKLYPTREIRVVVGLPAGSGGDGNRLQFTPGSASTGPVVTCEKVVATVYDQSQAMMVPGAVEVLPSNVQLSVLPLFVIVHVSVSDGPETPKLAVATVGRVTESTADAEAPPYEPLIVAEIVPPTALVEMTKVALAEPAGTVTLAGTVATGSLPDNVTTAPPAGAAPVSITVPFTVLPPTTLDVLNDNEERVGPAVTVRVGD